MTDRAPAPDPSADEPIEAELVEEPRPGRAPEPPAPATPAADYDRHGVPSFDHVRDKIERRYATALGSTELAEESAAGRALEQQAAERAKVAAARLAEIRKSLRR